MQLELTPGELLDEAGSLAERGWARSEIKRYRRASIRAPRHRIKEWDYYCVLAKDYGLALTVADNSYMGFLAASWLDFRAPAAINESVMIPFPMGRMELPESADAGDIIERHPRIALAFRRAPGSASIVRVLPAARG